MTAARILGVAVLAGMAVAIWFGFSEGDFAMEASEIWAMPWGRVSLADLYLGLAIFGAWVAVRETRLMTVVAWWIGLLLLGNLAAGAYLTLAAFRARDMRQLLLGDKTHDSA